jgi:hypothetical protein
MDIIVIIVMLVICCCCIILSGGGYYFLQQKDDNTSASASGSNSSAPASGSNASAPASGSNASAPASGNNASAPASGSNASAPASGNNASAPSSGSNASAPTSPSPTTPKPIPYKFQKLALNVNALKPGLPLGINDKDTILLKKGVKSYDDCVNLALSHKDIDKINAITWHSPRGNYGDWKETCYGLTSKDNLSPNYSDGVESGIKQIEPPSNKYKFTTDDGANCIWGQVPQPYVSSNRYNYIGNFDSYSDCEKAALADPNIDKLKAVSWHKPNYPVPEWRNLCYTIDDTNVKATDPNSTCGTKTSA